MEELLFIYLINLFVFFSSYNGFIFLKLNESIARLPFSSLKMFEILLETLFIG